MLASGICERTRVTLYHQGLLLDYVDAKADGPTVFRHACKLGLEGIVSKRLGSRNQSGRLPHWLTPTRPGEDGRPLTMKPAGEEASVAHQAGRAQLHIFSSRLALSQ
jgi:hypothetical protein